MRKFAEAFVRNPDGSWFCRATAEFVLDDGRRVSATPGVTYRRGKSLLAGRDIARWLDDWAAHGTQPPGIEFDGVRAQAGENPALQGVRSDSYAELRICARLLKVAEAASGGAAALAAKLRVAGADLLQWREGRIFPPEPVFEAVLEIVLEAHDARLAKLAHRATGAATGNAGRILIAESRQGAEAVTKLLPLDADLVVAHTHEEALAILQREEIGLLLCGVGFEGSGLLRFLQELRTDERARAVPVICYRTASTEPGEPPLAEVRSACEALGALACIDLPEHPSSSDARSVEFRDAVAAASYFKRRRPAQRVLVVDGDAETPHALGTLLEVAGHDVRRARDGQAALDAASSFRPDVAVLDITLPGRSGYEVAAGIRRQTWADEALLIAIAALGSRTQTRGALRSGFDYLFTKPVDIEHVLEVFPGSGG